MTTAAIFICLHGHIAWRYKLSNKTLLMVLLSGARIDSHWNFKCFRVFCKYPFVINESGGISCLERHWKRPSFDKQISGKKFPQDMYIN
ncbi:hypothetical protein CEXT_767931 [Caerostris extrusa]|uniref:Secreted protein n=1 Tax=Caerostris extrusa TaxID=172846 RepID=A0AAV4VA25_CAEEX|nr:hypothetical protein CEXT_767931 [Caerostris extrusa]